MDESKKVNPMEEEKTPEGKEWEKGKDLSLDDLEKVTGGSMRDTVRTKTEDITDSIKNRI
ncbi:MAG: hypothetical protein AAGU27_01725 [Dehalobacterium sp.]